MGVPQLMDLIVQGLPSPTEREAVEGFIKWSYEDYDYDITQELTEALLMAEQYLKERPKGK